MLPEKYLKKKVTQKKIKLKVEILLKTIFY